MTTQRGTAENGAGSELERNWRAGSWAEARAERERLVAMGDAGVPALVLALQSEDGQVRWEAAKGLVDVRSAAAGPALVEALEDQSGGVRWLAAEGLIELGPAALDPLLHALMQHSESAWLREGAHHVLGAVGHGQLWPMIQPVVRALESVEPAIGVLVPARNALDALRAATG
jgi:HEAT repeat protein